MNSSLAPLQNYAPEDETRTMIRKMIQESGACLDSSRSMLESARARKEIASKTVERLRHQLAEAERAEIVAIHGFEAARKIVSDIEDAMAEHKVLLHPIRYLPSDILREIFEYCIEDDDHEGNMVDAISLSSVCRSWRLVAHSLGSLWRHIDFSLWNPSDQDIFDTFIERSTYYLNVRIGIDFDWGPMASAPFSFTTFPFDRIRTLIIFIYSDVPISQELFNMLHNLTRLKICAYLESASAYMLQGDCLLHCQTLEELELEGVQISLNDHLMLPELVRLSWKVHQEYDSLIPIFLKRLFGHAPHLESFSFSSSYPMDMEDVYLEDRNFQPLRELTSLRIECPSSRHAMAPFLEDSSLIPSLQHLTLASVDISDLLDSFVQYAEAVHLTKLTLEVTPYAEFGPDDDLVQRLMVLRHLRDLERLEVVAEGPPDWLSDHDYSEYFITCLCKVFSECTAHPILPSLRIIRFFRYSGASMDDIIEMVKARIVAARVSPEELAPLESVTFEDCEPLNVDQYRRLKAALGHDSS
jgi:hypothetical protein